MAAMAFPLARLIATEKTAKCHPSCRVFDIKTKFDETGKTNKFWIGRHPDADVVLLDGTISRLHACLKLLPNPHPTWMIMDNKSTNGVKLNRSYIPKEVDMLVKDGDSINIVNESNSYEWIFHDLNKVEEAQSSHGAQNISEKMQLKNREIAEKHKSFVSKIKEEKLSLEKKAFEIEKEKKQLEKQKEDMAKLLETEKEEFAAKQAKELAMFESRVNFARQEAVQSQRNTFEQRLKEEKIVADEQFAEKEKKLAKSIEDAEARLQKLTGEKDNIIISLEFEMEQNQQKMDEMKNNFDNQLNQLTLDCKNEKASAQEHRLAMEELKNNFNDILKQNQEEMEETIGKIKLDKEKEQMETHSIKQELEERDKEIARLKEELNEKAQSSNELSCAKILSKCNEELKCSICDELFIEPMELGCGHVYCKHCLEQWEANCGMTFAKFNCPNCREPITQFNKSLHLDNLISSLYKGLNETLRKEREDLIKERKAEELASKERQEVEKRHRKEQLERYRSSRRGRGNRRVNEARPINVIREALRNQTRQYENQLRERSVERRRNLQEVGERLIASERDNAETSNTSNIPNTRNRVRARVNEIRHRLTEMTRRRNGNNATSGENSQARPDQTRQQRQIAGTNSNDSPVSDSAAGTSPPTIDLAFSLASVNPEEGTSTPQQENSYVDLTQENEQGNLHHDTEDNISSQSSTESTISSSSSLGSPNSLTLSESSIEGIPGALYGGYGSCYLCGRRGHWAPGCPFEQ